MSGKKDTRTNLLLNGFNNPTLHCGRRLTTMSNYHTTAKNPVSGEIQQVAMLDGYFEGREYGIRFPNGQVLPEEKVEIISERIGE